MLPEIRAISFTNFRANASKEIDYITNTHAHLWIMRRGKPAACVIPMRDEAVLSKVHGRDLSEMMARMDVDRERLEAAMRTARDYEVFGVTPSDWTYPAQRLVE